MAGAERNTSQIESFSLYLREIGEIPLLSAVEERELLVQFKKGETAQEKLASNDGELSSAEKHELEMIIGEGEEAWGELITSNLRLVVSVAKGFQGRGLGLPDLVGEGSFGLVKAIDGFDLEERNLNGEPIRFSTYAVYWIRQTIHRAIADQARVIRLPVHVIEEFYRIKGVANSLKKNLGREPTAKEIGAELGLTEEKVLTRLQQGEPVISLNMLLSKEKDLWTELEDMIVDEEALSPEEEAELESREREVNDWLKELTPKERQVIELRFGLDGGGERTLEEIGEEFELSRERIRQIQDRAIKKLRYQATIARRKDMFLRGIKW